MFDTFQMEAAVSTDMEKNSGRPERPTMMIGIDWVPDVAPRNNRKKDFPAEC